MCIAFIVRSHTISPHRLNCQNVTIPTHAPRRKQNTCRRRKCTLRENAGPSHPSRERRTLRENAASQSKLSRSRSRSGRAPGGSRNGSSGPYTLRENAGPFGRTSLSNGSSTSPSTMISSCCCCSQRTSLSNGSSGTSNNLSTSLSNGTSFSSLFFVQRNFGFALQFVLLSALQELVLLLEEGRRYSTNTSEVQQV